MTAFLRRAALAFSMLALAAPSAWAENNGVPPAMMQNAPPPVVTPGSCSGMSQIDFKADSAPSQQTASGKYVAVPNAALSFKQGTAGCVVVTFSASTFAPGLSRAMLIRAVLDGSTVAEPGEILFAAGDNSSSAAKGRAYSFVLTGIAAGAHTIGIQWKSGTGGTTVYLTKHTLVVTHS